MELICYCLMPNHFHFLLKQKLDNGVSKFVGNFTNSYTRYFNTKHDNRVGPLFQGTFKAVHIDDDEQLIHVSRYIHINPTVSFIEKIGRLEKYHWSSLPEYLGLDGKEICDKDLVMGFFSSTKAYRKFIYDQVGYSKELKKIEHLLLE